MRSFSPGGARKGLEEGAASDGPDLSPNHLEDFAGLTDKNLEGATQTRTEYADNVRAQRAPVLSRAPRLA